MDATWRQCILCWRQRRTSCKFEREMMDESEPSSPSRLWLAVGAQNCAIFPPAGKTAFPVPEGPRGFRSSRSLCCPGRVSRVVFNTLPVCPFSLPPQSPLLCLFPCLGPTCGASESFQKLCWGCCCFLWVGCFRLKLLST